MIRTLLAGHIRAAAEALLAEAGQPWPQGLEVQVEQPKLLEHGDYATNLAMLLARPLRRAPVQIAQELRARLAQVPLFARAEVAGPGFLNFHLNWAEWGRMGFAPPPPAERARQKVVVEHTSINPNKAAHVGHLRNSCIGDTLSRLLRRTGYKVEVHNYIDDLGNQVADTVVGILNVPAHGDHRRFGDFCWDVYARVNQAYKENDALKDKRAETLHALEEGGNNTAWIGGLVAERIVREHTVEMGNFAIDYDLLVWESNIVREGFWTAAFEKLQRSPLFVKEAEGKLAGCWVLKQPEAEGPDEEHNPDKVLVRSNGVLTYTAKDIAYHLWKFGLLGKDFRYTKFMEGLWTSSRDGVAKPFGRASKVLNVIDKRQEYPQAMVKLALQTLGFPEAAANLHHVGYGVVSLSPATAARLGLDTAEGKASYAMSGRQGIGIKVSDLLNQMEATIDRERARKAGVSSRAIAAGAIRYYLLRFNLGTEIVFDIDSALDIRGNTGPYAMYAHARASGILRKAGANEKAVPPVPALPAELVPAERALMRHIADWPDTLEQAAADLSPTLLTNAVYELATLYNQFYEAAPVLKAAEPEKAFRLWLTAVARATLADGLGVLGLPAPNRM